MIVLGLFIHNAGENGESVGSVNAVLSQIPYRGQHGAFTCNFIVHLGLLGILDILLPGEKHT